VDYISCFSGIGGLEGSRPPIACCEIDPECQKHLRQRFPSAAIHDDIRAFQPPRAHLVAGGWPCQDISIAGNQSGLEGSRSGLLHELVRVARQSRADVLLAENVANLTRLGGGSEFARALQIIHDGGFPYISWRVVNARDFGLPQHRTRLLLIASRREADALTLFRSTPALPAAVLDERKRSRAAGFYWTAGTHSINYSPGYCPTVKIGSSLNIPSPPAVHFSKTVRLLSPIEALRLQGFDDEFDNLSNAALYRMAGNAVPRPMGQWLFDGIDRHLAPDAMPEALHHQLSLFGSEFPQYRSAGVSKRGKVVMYTVPKAARRAVNLIDYLDTTNRTRLSARAAAGLLARLHRSGQPCPEKLRGILESCATANEASDG
jgi:DNA (cytosine-5)-methyltransferase 1